ncbi:MAG: hypothetical protein KAQ71_15710, partial [Desulfobulbaceae bacterium]|nr:hypothetical protein [Desulfobulbaceae bacterium]
MKRFILTMLICLMLSVTTSPVMGTEAEQQKDPLQAREAVHNGFFSSLDTSVRFGSGVGFDLDAEELLDVDSKTSVFRVGGLWRFTDTKRHRLDLSWFAFHRDGSSTVGSTIEIEDPDGDIITILPGTEVDTLLNIDIFQLAYSYSFLQDDRIDLAAVFGLFIMPIDIEIEVTGVPDEEGILDFTAPLPTFGLRMDFALTPKWFFRSGTQVFYLEYEDFKGSLLATHGAVEYMPWDRI